MLPGESLAKYSGPSGGAEADEAAGGAWGDEEYDGNERSEASAAADAPQALGRADFSEPTTRRRRLRQQFGRGRGPGNTGRR